jgi:ferredoxin-NADP reductase
VSTALLTRHVPDPAPARYFLCGPGDFAEILAGWLCDHGVPREQIHSEQFGGSPQVANSLRSPTCQARNDAAAVLS